MAPVHVRDVAAAFVKSLETPDTVHGTFVLCGPDSLSWRVLITRIAEACGRRKLMLPAPALPLRLAGAMLDRFAWFPITRDQLTMLLEGNTGDSTEVYRMLDIAPTAFSVENLAYLTGTRV
jgi:NADH dehydrogenase